MFGIDCLGESDSQCAMHAGTKFLTKRILRTIGFLKMGCLLVVPNGITTTSKCIRLWNLRKRVLYKVDYNILQSFENTSAMGVLQPWSRLTRLRPPLGKGACGVYKKAWDGTWLWQRAYWSYYILLLFRLIAYADIDLLGAGDAAC